MELLLACLDLSFVTFLHSFMHLYDHDAFEEDPAVGCIRGRSTDYGFAKTGTKTSIWNIVNE